MSDKIISILIMLSAISMNGYSQSVETFIEMAKSNNHELRSLQLEYDAALLKANQVNDWPDPQVSLGIGVLPVETRLGAQRLKVGVTQMIPWKGSLDAKSKIFRANAEVKSHFDEVKEIDIEFIIRSAYSTLNFLDAKKLFVQERLKVLDALEELAKSAVQSGKGKLSNVLFTERKKEILLADLDLLTKKMEQPTIIINRWAGRELSDNVNILREDNLLDKSEILKYAESNHPQYHVLDSKINASNSVINYTKFQVKPKIGVGLDYAYIDARNDVDIPNNGRDVLMPMGSVTIPLNKGKYKAIKQEEMVRQESIKAQKDELQDSYKAEIEMAYTKIEYSDKVIAKFLGLKEITSETLKLMRVEYASEGTRFEELLRLEMELIDYDLEILKAGYERDLAFAVLYKFR